MADQQTAELAEPGVGAFDDPAAAVATQFASVLVLSLPIVLPVGDDEFDTTLNQSKIPASAINLQQRFWCFLPQDMQRLWQPILALSLRNHAAVWVLGYGPRQAPNPRVRVACAYARQSAQPYDDRSAGDL
jgi:hypothetical protein